MGQDCNSPSASSMGLFNVDMAIHPNGQRASAYNTYLNKKLALSRQQYLTVCTGVVVSKLDVDEHAGLVRGVHIQSINKEGQDTAYVHARREVIICSGAICTPQILLLSGIGPKSQLDALEIPVKKDLLVRTIQSHLEAIYGWSLMYSQHSRLVPVYRIIPVVPSCSNCPNQRRSVCLSLSTVSGISCSSSCSEEA